MNYQSDVRAHITSLEHSKFVEIQDTRYPAVSVTRVQYPESNLMPPVSTVEVYPKHAVLAYIANSEDVKGGGLSLSSTDTLLSVLTGQVKNIQSLSNVLTAQNAVKVSGWGALSASVSNIPTQFPSTPATLVSILNNTGTDILVQNSSNLPAFPLPYGGVIEIYTVANANEISLTRQDGDSTPVTMFALYTNRS